MTSILAQWFKSKLLCPLECAGKVPNVGSLTILKKLYVSPGPMCGAPKAPLLRALIL